MFSSSEIQRCSVNSALVAVISFSEIRRYHKGPSKVDKEDGRLELCF
jgi:hypothetical protein